MGASVGASRGRRRGGIVGINVTPMVDVMLVLLVIMMVSSIYIVSRALKVELPKTASSDEAAQAPVTVTLTKDGKTFIGGELIASDAELSSRFGKARAASGDPSLVVSADAQALHGRVVHVIDLAKVQGITKFAINVA
ncbi:MAG TPA: biopolymer transporter ExbD, partial [Polyangiaceae bacterium]